MAFSSAMNSLSHHRLHLDPHWSPALCSGLAFQLAGNVVRRSGAVIAIFSLSRRFSMVFPAIVLDKKIVTGPLLAPTRNPTHVCIPA